MGYALVFNLERLRQILINVRMSEKEQLLKPALHNFNKAIEQGKKDAMDYVMQSREIHNEIQTIRKKRMEE